MNGHNNSSAVTNCITERPVSTDTEKMATAIGTSMGRQRDPETVCANVEQPHAYCSSQGNEYQVDCVELDIVDPPPPCSEEPPTVTASNGR